MLFHIHNIFLFIIFTILILLFYFIFIFLSFYKPKFILKILIEDTIHRVLKLFMNKNKN